MKLKIALEYACSHCRKLLGKQSNHTAMKYFTLHHLRRKCSFFIKQS